MLQPTDITPLTSEQFEQLRTLKFITGLNAYAGHFDTDAERELYAEAVKHHNARVDLAREVVRLQGYVAELETAGSWLLDALRAVHEALAIPHAATVGGAEIRQRILGERALETVVVLDVLLGQRPYDPQSTVNYLRERLAEHPPVGYATTTPQPLPVRVKHSEAELKVLDAWMQDHGDPGEWTEEVRLAYAEKIARMRAGGALSSEPLIVYRAQTDEIPLGTYTHLEDAQAHCEGVRATTPHLVAWYEDEPDAEELTTLRLYVDYGDEQLATGYAVVPVPVLTAYDAEA
jgi:hypothetical protein